MAEIKFLQRMDGPSLTDRGEKLKHSEGSQSHKS